MPFITFCCTWRSLSYIVYWWSEADEMLPKYLHQWYEGNYFVILYKVSCGRMIWSSEITQSLSIVSKIVFKGIDTLIFFFLCLLPYNVYFLNPGLMPMNVMVSLMSFSYYFISWSLSPEEILTQDFASVISS